MSKTSVLGSCILLAGFLLSSVTSTGCRGHADKHITFATSKNIWCSLGILASEKRFFEEEGLDVTVTYLDAGRYCLDALVSQSANLGTIVEVNIAYFGFTRDTSVEIVASLVDATASAIVARQSSGIHKPEDLRGKTLALSPGTTSEIFAARFLMKYGLTSKDVQLVKIQPVAMVAAVTSRSVDAASTWDPHVYNIKRSLGDDIVEFRDGGVYTGYLNLAVRKDWANDNQEAVTAFLRALKKAERYVVEHKDEAQHIVAKAINLDLETIRATWQYHNMTVKLDTAQMKQAITAIGEWIQSSDDAYIGKPLPDYSPYLNPQFLIGLAQ